MFRHLVAAALSVVILAPTFAADAKDAKKKLPVLRWYGQSFFQFETSKGTRIVFDPHAIEAYGRPMVSADLVLISHRHNDHTQVDVLENAGKFKVIQGLVEKGKKLDWNLIDEKFKDVQIRTVGVYHDEMEGMERGKNTVFILEFDGLRFVFLGDLGHTLKDQQIKAIGTPDVLLIPVGGIYTLNGADAKKVVEQLKPKKYIVPMHYGTKVFDDLLPADEFLDEQKNVKTYDGNRLELDVDFKPATPQIAMLNWK
jgi:L-ascorbate metabolism protein UlaG (beta-lactamase superfamily)